mgnify:CR=1 FL=1
MEGIIPDAPRFVAGLEAEFEGDAAEYQRDQHESDRHVDGRHQGRIGLRESREKAAAAQDQPLGREHADEAHEALGQVVSLQLPGGVVGLQVAGRAAPRRDTTSTAAPASNLLRTFTHACSRDSALILAGVDVRQIRSASIKRSDQIGFFSNQVKRVEVDFHVMHVDIGDKA